MDGLVNRGVISYRISDPNDIRRGVQSYREEQINTDAHGNENFRRIYDSRTPEGGTEKRIDFNVSRPGTSAYYQPLNTLTHRLRRGTSGYAGARVPGQFPVQSQISTYNGVYTPGATPKRTTWGTNVSKRLNERGNPELEAASEDLQDGIDFLENELLTNKEPLHFYSAPYYGELDEYPATTSESEDSGNTAAQRRCRATTRRGERCRNQAHGGSRLCHQHRASTAPPRNVAKARPRTSKVSTK